MLKIPGYLYIDIVDNSFYRDFPYDELVMPLEISSWEKILKPLSSMKISIHLSGLSDPALYPEFRDFLLLLKKLNLSFSLHSGGFIPHGWDLIRFLKKIPTFEEIYFTFIPGGNTIEGHWQPEENLEELKNCIRRASRNGFITKVSVPMISFNTINVGRIIKSLLHLGANKIIFRRYLGAVRMGLTPYRHSLQAALRKINELRKRGLPVAIGNCFPQCFSGGRSYCCTAARAFLVVDPFGNVRGCFNSRDILGNLLESSLQKIWRSEARIKFRDSLPPGCRDCDYLRDCLGGCKLSEEQWGVRKDPLMSPTDGRRMEEEKVFGDVKPKSDFSIRKEDFGFVMISEIGVIPVLKEGYEVLKAVKKGTTLQEVESRFGKKAVEMIYSAFQRGLIELEGLNG